MDNNQSNNKRIAKNTIALYIRMLFSMAVGFYTSRVILNVLGISDYGIYNVVGSVVSMFSFLSGSMSLSTSRFLTFELGKNNYQRFEELFKSSITIHCAIALIVFIITEVIGLWFLYNKMTMPDDRLFAAQYVFQLSLISSIFSIVFIPFTSAIIAYEKMTAFAWMSIFDVTAKLVIVFVLQVFPYDKLIVYAYLIFFVTILNQVILVIYSKRKLKGTVLGLRFVKTDFMHLFSFAGWTMFGQITYVGFTQGLNMLLNMFFNPTVNAARGIAVQVQTIIYRFIKNVQTAFNPQITKNYAANQIEEMHKLVFACSKFSFYLLLIISAPVIIETPYILELWLKNVPDYTVSFFRIIIMVSFVDSLANPLIISNMATGKVKYWNIVCGTILFLIVPVSYICLKLGLPPISVFYVHFICAIVAQFTRLFFLRNSIQLSIRQYFKKVIQPTICVFVVSLACGFGLLSAFPEQSIIYLLLVCFLTFVSCCFSIMFIGLNSTERSLVYSKGRELIQRFVQK